MKVTGICLIIVLSLAIVVQAQVAAVSFRTGILTGPWCPITGPTGEPLADSSFIGIYLTGPDGEVDPPALNGEPTNDDVRATNNEIGSGLDHLIVHPNESGLVPQGNLYMANGNVGFPPAGMGIEPIANQGDVIYLRAFNSNSPETATHYNDLYTVNGVVQSTYIKTGISSEIVYVCFTDAIALGTLIPGISVSPTTLDFGTVTVGQLEELELTIYSVGTDTLVLYDIASSDPCFSTDFDPADSLLAPMDSLVVTVGFTPQQAVEYRDTLSISNNDELVEIMLSGDGYAPTPEISLSTDSLGFGTETVGDTSDYLPLTIYNVGDDTLVIYGITNSEICFLHDFDPADSLIVPGDSLIITVGFAPQQVMLYEDTLRIDNNDVMAEVCLTGTGEAGGVPLENLGKLPETFALQYPYPNPFNAVTCMSYDVPVSGTVRVEVYDILGKKVATLIDGNVNAGSHQVIWDARGLPSGVYFVQMGAGEFQQIRKVVLLK